MNARVGVVVLNWNNWPDTLGCLRSLAPALHDTNVCVVLVDNASTDDSFEQLRIEGASLAKTEGLTFRVVTTNDKEPLPAIALLASGRNGGFAAGNNVGLRFLRERGSFDYFWLLNNDTAIEPDAIKRLASYADANPAVGLVGSTILDFYERDRIQCAGGAYYHSVVSLNRMALENMSLDAARQTKTAPINYVCGAAMFMRASMLEAVGLLNEAYFLYYEEIDYARRAEAKGYELAWCRESRVYHKGGVTTGGNRNRNRKKSYISEYHANLSCLIYTQTFHPRTFALTSALRFGLKCCFQAKDRQWDQLKPLWDAYRDFFGAKR